MDEAGINYRASIAIRPLASAYYNLSQVSREGLDFEKGNEYFSRALEIDRNAVTGIPGRSLGRTQTGSLLMRLFPLQSLWNLDVANAREGSHIQPFWLPHGLFRLQHCFPDLRLLYDEHNAGNKAYRCRRCNEIFCPRCEKHIMWGTDVRPMLPVSHKARRD